MNSTTTPLTIDGAGRIGELTGAPVVDAPKRQQNWGIIGADGLDINEWVRHMMRASLFLILYLLLCVPPPVQAAIASRITEAQVHQILEAIDVAARRKDAEGIVRYFAKDCIIRLDMPGPHGRQVLQVNREEYATSLKESFSALTGYKYRRAETKIHIAPDGKSARVTGQIFETMTMGDRILNATTKHSAIFEVRSGELLITSLDTTFLSMEEELIS